MKLCKCDNGHYYDSDKYPVCPHCESERNQLLADSRQKDKVPPDSKLSSYGDQEPFAFISYSHENFSTVKKYIDALNGKYHFWYDEGIKSGDEWLETIAIKIYSCDIFIVFLSPEAVNSQYIIDEINYAYKYAKRMMTVILEPVTLSRSLELILTRFQYIDCKKELTDEDAITRLINSLPQSIAISASAPVPSEKSTEPVNTDTSSDAITPAQPADRKNPEDDRALFDDLYEMQELIGKGGSGDVYSVRSKRTGAEYVMKRQHFENQDADRFKVLKAISRNELEKLLLLNNKPYTPVLIDYIENEEDSYLIMSRTAGIDLRTLLKNYSTLLTTEIVISLVYKIALILHDIQLMGLVYGDVKPSNFILNEYGQVCIVDFGSTYSVDDRSYIKIHTPHYAAPELTNHLSTAPDRPDFSSDVYSLGVMFSDFVSYIPAFTFGLNEIGNKIVTKICKKMTAQAIKNRYRTVGEVISVLELIVPDDYEAEMREFANCIDFTQHMIPSKEGPDSLIPSRTVAFSASDGATTGQTSVVAFSEVIPFPMFDMADNDMSNSSDNS